MPTPLDQINWTDEYSGAGVPLGNLDGWPAVNHPDIAGRVTIAQVTSNVSFAPMSWNADHSTGVAGITVGKSGVARGANLYVSPFWTASDKFAAYEFYRASLLRKMYDKMAAVGVKAVNRELNSKRSPWGLEATWGWRGWSFIATTTDLDTVAEYPQFVHVQPSGNQSVPLGSQPTKYAASSFDHLLIVGAVDGANRIWPETNTPQSRGMYAPGDTYIKPEKYLKNFFVCAPGVGLQIPASPSGYNYWSGTSLAAPYVTGLVGLMYEKAARIGVALSPQRCARIIRDTCKPLGPAEIYGHGIIDVKAALEAVR